MTNDHLLTDDGEWAHDAPATVDAYKPFPVDALPDTLKRYTVEASESIGCDAAYVALPLLTAAGAVIGNARRLHVKSTWYSLPTLWTVIVGESGTAKTPALTEALAPIKRLQRDALNRYEQKRADYDSAVQQYDADLATHKKKRSTGEPLPAKPDAPVPERLTVSNATVEALAPILRDNLKGVLLHRDELAGWFGSFNRYIGKSGADEADWLSLHNGDGITVDRKTDGTVPLHVASGVVSITGGIQPAILQKAFSPEQRASGMAARLLIASPPRATPLWSETELNQWTREKCFALFDDLASLQLESDEAGRLQSVIVKMTPEAKLTFIRYFNAHQRQYPNHVINKWLGHSSAVAERHYLQVTKDDWADGATRETVCKNRQTTPQPDDRRCRPYDSGGGTGGDTHANTGGHSRTGAQKKPVKTRLHAPTGSGIAAQATPQGLEP